SAHPPLQPFPRRRGRVTDRRGDRRSPRHAAPPPEVDRGRRRRGLRRAARGVSELTGTEAEAVTASRAFGRDAVETITFATLGLLVAFPTTIITSRYLHPDGRGAYVLGVVTVLIAAALTGNIGVAVGHQLKRAQWDRPAIATNALLASFGLGVVGAVVLIPLETVLVTGFRAIAAMPVALPAMLVTGTLTATLVALGRVRARNLILLAI